MIDPRGQWFISYKREFAHAVKPLALALHERGIPTWIDTANLAHEPTHDALRDAIRHEHTAGAVLFATDRVQSSQTIRLVEAPEILRRWRLDRSFGVVPVISNGVDYADVNAIYGDAIADHDLSLWNIYRAQDEAFSQLDAVAVSRRILEQRIQAVHQFLPDDAAFDLLLHTRERPPLSTRGLCIDWSHRFDPRHCAPEEWNGHLLPALHNIASAIRQFAPGRAIVAEGLLGIPAAYALGAAFPTTRGVSIGWRQVTPHAAPELWDVSSPPTEVSLRIQAESRTLDAADVAVLVSITSDVRRDFARTIRALPALRCIVDASLSTPSQRLTGAQAATVARAVIDAVREARTTYGAHGTMHLFIAGPVGLAMMLGQLSNTFTRVSTYEYVGDQEPPYRPAVTIVNH